MSQDLDTIQRCPHDAENPYAQISRALIRDKSISPECRWLLIYLLSMKDGWNLKVSQIHEHVKEFFGRDHVYKIVEEAINAGYVQRMEIKVGNLNRGCKYIISETPKFKKCFRLPDSQDTGSQDAGSQEALRKSISSSYEEDKKEHKKEREAPPPTSSPPLFFGASKRVKMTEEQYENLVKDFGKEVVDLKIEDLDEYADLKPSEFKKYGKHCVVLRKWIKKDLMKKGLEPKREEPGLNPIQKENLRLNDELVRELKLDYPDICGTMSIYYKAYLLKSKEPYFDISMLVDHREFCRFLSKHLKMNILEVRFPNG